MYSRCFRSIFRRDCSRSDVHSPLWDWEHFPRYIPERKGYPATDREGRKELTVSSHFLIDRINQFYLKDKRGIRWNGFPGAIFAITKTPGDIKFENITGMHFYDSFLPAVNHL